MDYQQPRPPPPIHHRHHPAWEVGGLSVTSGTFPQLRVMVVVARGDEVTVRYTHFVCKPRKILVSSAPAHQ